MAASGPIETATDTSPAVDTLTRQNISFFA